MKRTLALALLVLAVMPAQAAIVNVALDAPAFANGPIYASDSIARLTDGDRAPQIHGDAVLPPGFAYWLDLGSSRALNGIKLWPRQNACCPDRLSNVRVSVHDDDGAGNLGAEVWGADLFTDGSNAGSGTGIVVNVTASMGTGTFAGRWVKLASLADPVPNYALQISEVEVFGSVPPVPTLILTRQPVSLATAPGRTATFSVTAEVLNGNTNNITYQWQRDGGNILGATNPTYTTAPLCPADGGARFRAVVSHPGASDLSSAEAVVSFDFNYSIGAAVFANQPLYPGFPISNIIDGSLDTLTHGNDNIQPGYAYTINLGSEVGLSNIMVWARQDGCCPGRLTYYRVSVHRDNGGVMGAPVWSADLHTDGSNPGSTPGSSDVVTPALDPFGTFVGQWIKIESLENPVQNYALQISEVQAIGLIRPRLAFQSVAGGLELTWTGAALESANVVTGPWFPVVGATSPHSISFGGLRKFYRLHCP